MSKDMCRKERIRYLGCLGTTHYIHPNYINLRLDDGRYFSLIPPSFVEFVTMIDTTKPLETVDSGGGTSPMTFATLTSDGHILVSPKGKAMSFIWIIFDTEGKFVRSDTGTGTCLALRNKVITTTEYMPILPAGTPVVPISSPYFARDQAWQQNPEAQFLVRLHKTDGIVTNVDTIKRGGDA